MLIRQIYTDLQWDTQQLSTRALIPHLKTSIRSEVSDSGLAVGTNDIRAATHQFGDERTIRAKNKKYLTFKIGGQWKRVASVKVSIPPRPFLGISEEDEQDIKDTLEEIFEE